ncbi:uncharacterized protein PFL1_04408 [Pseudozyma flocculosa PF-1]|uniref:Amine oxidase domain-containing protein n=2 Tax=Pseudozyma flocculosa TaxID=84751 RepID=A0A5C3FCP3_9BASI|nr:uncharacterized protein PFL1_04408 [Pseudozyma flocculosa PF-1]EPQ28081.1 hypothetical protein PFL1_04408 [Pseudozyma flocculosa PF-1]SPO42204.1 uncharacterized protein PSFLO_07687 [Pseudozyma flocculosa]
MRVAVVGGGVSGLGAVWALNEHSDHEVHLFEPGEWIGGHTNTQDFVHPRSSGNESTPVDTGFIVFNEVTYPNLLRFFKLVGVEILDSEMSFSVSRYGKTPRPNAQHHATGVEAERGMFEWAGTSPAALFCQPRNLFNPAHWRMVWDIIRFNQQSVDYLRQNQHHVGQEISIGEWLKQRGYSDAFVRNYLIPVTASIWSTAPSTALSSFPAITLLRFMHNHHLLQLVNRPQWLTCKGGSRNYVERIISKLPDERIHRGKAGEIVSARRQENGWVLCDANRSEAPGRFDKVIFACHADTSVAILDEALPSDSEVRKTLERFHFSENVAVLHADKRLLPVRRQAWSAWNFVTETVSAAEAGQQANGGADNGSDDVDVVCLTYNMNILQHIPTSKFGDVLVTLNPAERDSSPYKPDPSLVLRTQKYTHPLYTPDTVQAQKELKPLQGRNGLFFAGAWTNYGFHEDGFSSGLRAAEAIEGVQLPFDVRAAERKLPASKGLNVVAVDVLDAAGRLSPVRWAAQATLAVLLYLFALEAFVSSLLLRFGLVDGKKLNGWKKEVLAVRSFLEDAQARPAGRVRSREGYSKAKLQ